MNLADRMKSTVLMSRASGTVNGYTRAFNRWKEFASRWVEVATFPAQPLPVALYLQYLLESTCSCSSIDAAFYGLKWVHDIAGLVSPTDSSLVVAVREASQRILGTGRSNRKEPMPRDLIKGIVDRADLSNGLELRNVCLYSYLLCFAGFLRFDDVSRVKRNEISFHSGYMAIKVEKSKNDQLRQGDEVLIAEGEGATCPVKILKEYLNMFNIDPMSNEFIAKQLIRTKKSYKLASSNKPISCSTFRDHLRKFLRGFVPDPQVYGIHSFRWGEASAAANSGVPDRVFQRHGRWKSATAKDGYVKDSTDVKLSVSRSLGL